MAVGCSSQYWSAMRPHGRSNMTFQHHHQVSMSTALLSGSGYNQLASDGGAGLGRSVNGNGYARATGGRHHVDIHPPRRTYYPPESHHPLIKSGNGNTFLDCIDRSRYLSKDDKLEADVPENDLCGRHFLFDNKYDKLQRTSTLMPPLPKGYHVHRSGNLHCFNLHKELSHAPAFETFTLGCYKEYDASPTVLCPATLALNGRNATAVDHYKLSRPKVNYRTCSLFTFRENQRRGQLFPDPVVGAPHSFTHRVSEISSLEGETVRQEKIKKMRKARKPDC